MNCLKSYQLVMQKWGRLFFPLYRVRLMFVRHLFAEDYEAYQPYWKGDGV